MSNIFDDVWFWGNPLTRKSYMYNLHGATYMLLREMTSQEFARTFPIWLRAQVKVDTNKDELLKVVEYSQEADKYKIQRKQEYIAHRLGCSQQRVSQLLLIVRIDEAVKNYWYEPDTSYSVSEDKIEQWYPSKKQIEHKMASLPRICALGLSQRCTGYTNDSKLSICYACHTKVKTEDSQMLLSEWVIEEENRIRREHYQKAVDACFADHYGTISIEEADSYLDAA